MHPWDRPSSWAVPGKSQLPGICVAVPTLLVEAGVTQPAPEQREMVWRIQGRGGAEQLGLAERSAGVTWVLTAWERSLISPISHGLFTFWTEAPLWYLCSWGRRGWLWLRGVTPSRLLPCCTEMWVERGYSRERGCGSGPAPPCL